MPLNIQTMSYPLKERIGTPFLLVEPKKEFAHYHEWLEGIPREASNLS